MIGVTRCHLSLLGEGCSHYGIKGMLHDTLTKTVKTSHCVDVLDIHVNKTLEMELCRHN